MDKNNKDLLFYFGKRGLVHRVDVCIDGHKQIHHIPYGITEEEAIKRYS